MFLLQMLIYIQLTYTTPLESLISEIVTQPTSPGLTSAEGSIRPFNDDGSLKIKIDSPPPLNCNGTEGNRKSCLKKIKAAAINENATIGHTVSFEQNCEDERPLDLDFIATSRTAETATNAVISMAAVATTASTNSRLQIREVRNSNERRRVFEGKSIKLLNQALIVRSILFSR